MAGCNWEKFKGGTESKAMFRHCDTERRLEATHSNADIDKSRTYLNMPFGAFEGGYENVCKVYDEYIGELDKNPGQNKRKDRVTLVGLSIPAPDGMDDETAAHWFIDVYEALYDRFGYTLIGGVAHFDEIHEYTDAETGEKRLSRPHLHAYAVPDIGGKLNAKQYTARRQMVALNNAVEAVTSARYPGYKFMTGKGTKSKKSVEQLKQESAYAEVVAEAEAEAAKIIEAARSRADVMEAEAADKTFEADRYAERVRRDASGVLSDARAKAEEIIEEAEKTSQRASEALSDALQSKAEMDEARKRYAEAARALNTFRRNYTTSQDEYMQKRIIRKADGTRESVFDGYLRDVVVPAYSKAEQAAKSAADHERRGNRRLPDMPKDKGDYGDDGLSLG